ncbi:SMP-30/gluconolactonase/LRE family protein [Streptomyces sp. NPDC048637]|uniref:SMP-30/gluconolactonase/LRE family protein n=1 Tax=Streptomyces sp. NPDC048637 TaxID=3155636 RepID=UPI00341D2498
MTTGQITVCAPDRLHLGEGGRWVDSRLVAVDIISGRLLELGPDSAVPLRVLAALDTPLGAVAPVAGAPATWIAAAGTGIALLGPSDHRHWLGRPAGCASRMRMNDGAADPTGSFWATSMAHDAAPGAGAVYRVDPAGNITQALDGITIPNGPAFSLDGTTMYLADSASGTVTRFPVDPTTGQLGSPSPFLGFGAGQGSPDGMTIDCEGNLWVALWGAGAVHRYRPDGTLDRIVEVPARQPTSVCLGAPHGRRLYITTASYSLDPAGPLDGAVLALDVDIPGPPAAMFRPRLGAAAGYPFREDHT